MAAYFTPSETDGANTLFLNRDVTHYMKEAGYVFCNIQHRITHFDALTDAMGLPRVPVNALEIKAGDVVVFDAPNLLHRRLIPKIAPRRLMMTALTPLASSLSTASSVSIRVLPIGNSLSATSVTSVWVFASQSRSSGSIRCACHMSFEMKPMVLPSSVSRREAWSFVTSVAPEGSYTSNASISVFPASMGTLPEANMCSPAAKSEAALIWIKAGRESAF